MNVWISNIFHSFFTDFWAFTQSENMRTPCRTAASINNESKINDKYNEVKLIIIK